MFIKEEKIREIIKEEIEKALTVEVTWEKRRDDTTGLPLKHPEIKTVKEYLPVLLTRLLPYHEGALRGMQETVDKKVAENHQLTKQIQAVGNILLGHEENLVKFARFIAYVQEKGLLMEPEEMQLIEGEVVEEDESSS